MMDRGNDNPKLIVDDNLSIKVELPGIMSKAKYQQFIMKNNTLSLSLLNLTQTSSPIPLRTFNHYLPGLARV
jgi:hypothetical protein